MKTIRGTSGFTMNSQCFRHAISGIAISGPRTRSSGEFIALWRTSREQEIVFQTHCKTIGADPPEIDLLQKALQNDSVCYHCVQKFLCPWP